MNDAAKHNIALQDYIDVVRRRKWIVIAFAVLVPLVALGLAMREVATYEASAKVLLSRQNLANTLTGVPDPNASVLDETLVKTQADVARAPEIARRVLVQLDLSGVATEKFLDKSAVTTEVGTQVLTFTVSSTDSAFAVRGATEYAQQYIVYRRDLDTGPLQNARQGVSKRLQQLRADGEAGGTLYASLLKREDMLRTMQALQTSNAQLIQSATAASQVSPKPTRDALIGLVLGLVLGLAVAFLRDVLDTRVRTANEISERLGLPLLARISAPDKKLAAENKVETLAEPMSQHAEAFRMLRSNLEFAMLDRDVRSIMITSALAGEGKSTTIANLALAFARAGRHVILVDLDLRQPKLASFFDLNETRGITQVVLGRAPLEDAMARVPILPTGLGWTNPEPHESVLPATSTNGTGGTLDVIASGPLPPDPGEFVASHALERVLAELYERADLVLIDSPPLLDIGDAMTLSAGVDALILITRLQMLRRAVVTETQWLLATTATHPLGFVLAGAETEAGYGYGHGHYYSYGSQQREEERVR